MHGAPPLVYFALGALYNKIGNHEAAVNHLAYVVENENSDESTYVHPSVDLRNYVKVLRKIEREPTEAPQTSAAIRSLERTRKNRAGKLLEDSRQKLQEMNTEKAKAQQKQIASDNSNTENVDNDNLLKTVNYERYENTDQKPYNKQSQQKPQKRPVKRSKDDMFANRKPITEVLHDIYDKNIQ
jgi:hypothetical protein